MLSSSTFSFSATSRWLRDVVLGGLIAVLAFELLVSTMGWIGVALPSDYPMERTPNAEFVFPGVYYTFPEFETPVTLNALAFHDIERSEKPATGFTRAALWGDSIFEGYQVERHELATQQLEKALQKDGHNIEVLNLGYSGGRAATLSSTQALDQIEGLEVDLLLVELHSLMEANHALAGGQAGFLPAGFVGFPEAKSNSLKHWLVDKAGLDGLYLLQQRARSIVRQKGEERPPDFFYRRHDIDAEGRAAAWDRWWAAVRARATAAAWAAPSAIPRTPARGRRPLAMAAAPSRCAQSPRRRRRWARPRPPPAAPRPRPT